MKDTIKSISIGLSISLFSSSAYAGGLERQIYSSDILFEKGTRIEAAWSTVDPSVTTSAGLGLVTNDSNINPSYDNRNIGIKFDLGESLAVAVTTYSPLGYSLAYPGPGINVSANVKSQATALSAKYQVNESFAVFGAATHIKTSAKANNLPGVPLPVVTGSGSDWGYVIGAAYMKPEIAMRISLSYESGTEHSNATALIHPILGALAQPVSKSSTPEAIKLQFQTGIAADTLLFGYIRHAYNSDANLFLSGNPLTSFTDKTTYNLGIGRKINDFMSVSVNGTFEDGSGSSNTLNPTDGKFTLAGGAKFQVTEHMDLTTGVSYTWLGDNTTKDTAGSLPFDNNSAFAWGAKVGWSF